MVTKVTMKFDVRSEIAGVTVTTDITNRTMIEKDLNENWQFSNVVIEAV